MSHLEQYSIDEWTDLSGWPGLPATIESLQWIVDNRSARILSWEGYGGADVDKDGRHGTFCDMQTANALCTVYDAVNDAHKIVMAREIAGSPGQFMRMVDFAWRHVK